MGVHPENWMAQMRLWLTETCLQHEDQGRRLWACPPMWTSAKVPSSG